MKIKAGTTVGRAILSLADDNVSRWIGSVISPSTRQEVASKVSSEDFIECVKTEEGAYYSVKTDGCLFTWTGSAVEVAFAIAGFGLS